MNLLTLDTTTPALPAGFTARPARLDDVEALVEMLNACSRALLGVNMHRSDYWTADLQAPGIDPVRDSCLVLDPEGRPAGFALMWDASPHVNPEIYWKVHPSRAGFGLDDYLLAWAMQRAQWSLERAPAGARVVMQAWIHQVDTRAHAVLRAWDFVLVRRNLRMLIDLDAPPPPPQWPAGVSVRTFVPGQDDRETYAAIRAAFRDHWGYVEGPFEEGLARWQHETYTDPDFDPGLWQLAIASGADGDRIIGTSLGRHGLPEDPNLGWISSVGVLRPWRKQGVAQALLLQTFAALYAHGLRRIGLGVDATSLTGATRLYEKVGMRPDPQREFGTWERELRPGVEVATTTVEGEAQP